MNRYRKTTIIFIVLFAFFSLHSVLGLDFNFRPKGFVSIPMGEANKTEEGHAIFGFGGGGDVGFEADISSVLPNPLGVGYTLGFEGGMLFNSLENDIGENVSFYSIGGVIGLYYFPISRLLIRADGAVGASISSFGDSRGDSGLYWRIGGEAGFRFTPGFTLAANIGWKSFSASGDVANTGLYAGLTAQITFQAGAASIRGGVTAQLDQDDPVYPLLMQLYQEYPAANIILQNNENAEIRNVRVYFRARGYTASEFLCETIYMVPRGRKIDVQLLADFSPDILRFTDSGRIMGELVIRYRFLGQEREVVRAVTVATNNRNTVPPGDTAAYAAFVSTTSPEVLDFSRFIAGLERTNRRSGVNLNYQYAVWLFEGIRASGIRIGNTFREDEIAQYPAETLSFTTGSNRDIALLFAACLESTGKRAAIIQTENDFLAAVSLGALQEAGNLANNRDRVLIVNNEVWLPLSMANLNNGFSDAWTQGASALNRMFAQGDQADFIIIQDAWATYPPAPLFELGAGRIRTDSTAATNAVNRVLGW